MFLILLFALLCTAPLSLVKWHLINDYDDDDDDDDDFSLLQVGKLAQVRQKTKVA